MIQSRLPSMVSSRKTASRQCFKVAVLRYSTLLLLIFSSTACVNQSAAPVDPQMASTPLTTNTASDPAINQLTWQSDIPTLQKLMNDGQLTAEALTEFYLAQIAAKNPQLNAVITVNPAAITIARQLDAERASGNIRGPLHGIPVLIKDNIETKTMPTTAGSLALKDSQAGRDATIIERLKQAGAIILGKTNLSEWANFRSERSSSGWSAVGGQTRNPHDLTRSPCGSSSGSGAAVAANLAVAAIGTETNGSITCPASANGIVGLKPTVGSVSRFGIVPISHSQDTAGPMTKFAVDSQVIFSVIKGQDPRDNATEILQTSEGHQADLSAPFALKGKRIGVVASGALGHESVKQAFTQAKQLLQSQGAILVEDLSVNPYQGFYQDTYDILLYEFKADLNTYLSSLPTPHNELTLAGLIEFNQRNELQEMPYFKQEIFEKSQAKGPLSDSEYLEKLTRIHQATRQDGIDRLMRENNLDVIISATLGPAWKIDLLTGDHFSGSFSTYPAVSGYPHVTLPMGLVHGMPVGISFTAEALSEDKVLNFAKQFERINPSDWKKSGWK